MSVGMSFNFRHCGDGIEVEVHNWTAEKLKEIWPTFVDLLVREGKFPTTIVLKMKKRSKKQ